jgi:hypothetical protein
MSENLTLREFADNLHPRYPEASDLVRQASYGNRGESTELFQQPLFMVIPRLCEMVVFHVWMNAIDMDAAPSADDELLCEFEHGKEDGLVSKTEDFESFRVRQFEERARRKEELDADHKGLRQLETALKEYGVIVVLDQPLGISEFCVAHGIAEEDPAGMLRFA